MSTSQPTEQKVVQADVVDVALVDVDTPAPCGPPCDACGAPAEPTDKFCTACGSPLPSSRAVSHAAPEVPPSRAEQNFFRCKNCGSEVATDPNRRSYVCPFCDSTYVIQLRPEDTDRQAPEFVIGFSVTSEQANEKFRHWIKQNRWFRPGDLHMAKIEEKIQGVYLPFWTFSMLARSRWSATIGEYWYRTETYWTTDSKGNRVQRTRQVRETEWWPLEGKHHSYYSGFMVSGSRGLPQKEAERIHPYQLPALTRYDPYYLAGWSNEEYSVGPEEAREICQQTFYRREQSSIAQFLPGDTHRDLQVQTEFSHVNSDLCLLPAFVLSYRYRDTLYRFLINGQTGKVAGDKPISPWRIALFVAGIVLVIAVVVLVIMFGAVAS